MASNSTGYEMSGAPASTNTNIDIVAADTGYHGPSSYHTSLWDDTSMIFGEDMPDSIPCDGQYENDFEALRISSNPFAPAAGTFGARADTSSNFAMNSFSPLGRILAALPSDENPCTAPTFYSNSPSTTARISKRKNHASGSGFLARPRLRHPYPTRQQHMEDKISKTKGDKLRTSSMEKAMKLLKQVNEVLGPDTQFTVRVKELLELVGEELIRGIRLDMHPAQRDNDSAYASSLHPTITMDMVNPATVSDLSIQGVHINHDELSFGNGGTTANGTIQSVVDDTQAFSNQRLGAMQTVYHCTFSFAGKMCEFSTRSKFVWYRHESSKNHWPQKRYMCLYCIESLYDEDGATICPYCFEHVFSVGFNEPHYLQCGRAKKSKNIFTSPRKDHFRTHLSSKHELPDISHEASMWIFDGHDEWPRECGFCTHQFASWDERIGHVAAHFKQGADISTWRISQRTKHPRGYAPGFKHRKDDDDDDDDNNGDSSSGRRGSWSLLGTALQHSAHPPATSPSNEIVCRGWSSDNMTRVLTSNISFHPGPNLMAQTLIANTYSFSRCSTSSGSCYTRSGMTGLKEIESDDAQLGLLRTHSIELSSVTSEESSYQDNTCLTPEILGEVCDKMKTMGTLLLGLELPEKYCHKLEDFVTERLNDRNAWGELITNDYANRQTEPDANSWTPDTEAREIMTLESLALAPSPGRAYERYYSMYASCSHVIYPAIDCTSLSLETLSSVFFPAFAFSHLTRSSIDHFTRSLISPAGLRHTPEYQVDLSLGFGPPMTFNVCTFEPRDRKAMFAYRKVPGQERFQTEASASIILDLFSIEHEAAIIDAWLDSIIDDEHHLNTYLELMACKGKDQSSLQMLRCVTSWYTSSKDNPKKSPDSTQDIFRAALKLLMTTTLLSLVPKLTGLHMEILESFSPRPVCALLEPSLIAPKVLTRQIKASIYHLQQSLVISLMCYLSSLTKFDPEVKVAVALLIAFVLDNLEKTARDFVRFAKSIRSSIVIKQKDVDDYETNMQRHVFGRVRASASKASGETGTLGESLSKLGIYGKCADKVSYGNDGEPSFVQVILHDVL